MPRPRTSRVDETKTKILTRIRDGFHRPGDRFLSNRAVARTFGVSFQTAQRLVTELCDEGWLQQRPSSGTYIAGSKIDLERVQLLVSQRTFALNGVYARLLKYLTNQLEASSVTWKADPTGGEAQVETGAFPVFCDCPSLAAVTARRHYALLLDDAPPPGLHASYIDSIAADDFSGGASAAQLFLQRKPTSGRFVIVAGPSNETKNAQRVAGFRSVIPNAKIMSAESWFYEDGLPVADQLLRQRWHGVFCCNDHLAKAVIDVAREQKRRCPQIIGFDNDPIAEELNLTSIEIPEQKMIEEALIIIRKRLGGDSSSASRKILSCRPVIRESLRW